MIGENIGSNSSLFMYIFRLFMHLLCVVITNLFSRVIKNR